MSYIQRSAGFLPGGAPSWPLSQPPCWRGYAGNASAMAWWQPGDVLALDFANGRYMREEETASLAAVLSVSRTSPATWFTEAGVLKSFAANVPAITDRGLYPGGQRVNKETNDNASPPALVTPADLASFNAAGVTNVTASGGDGNALFGIVDDSAAISAAGLGEICNGNVFKIDNSAGASRALLIFGGTPGNVNTHAGYAYARGAGAMEVENGAARTAFSGASYAYRDIRGGGGANPTFTPPSSSLRIAVSAGPGETVYCILNSLEEGTFASPPVVTAGAAATRLADAISIPDFSTLATVFGFADGFVVKSRVYFDPAIPVTQGIWAFGQNSNNYLQLYIATGGYPRFRSRVSGVDRFTLEAGQWLTAGWKDVECRAIDGAWQIVATGLAGAIETAGRPMPTLSVGQIGRLLSGTGFETNGPIGEIRVGVAS